MRISDWSSDVCSSDLNTLATAHTIRLTRSSVRSGFFPRPVLAMVSPLTMNEHEATAQRIPQACTFVSESPYASISAMNTPPRKLLKVAKKISANSPGTAATTRSEEHTSELQSLMRISYAV